ncbi:MULTISPECIES: CCA tRNA nucleotidyltransferase [unclassified Leucobacter]|uniref:CCA tRNA nucleotidyltransferase n=1 Tax=unclassified Leucobacter TaxID=2621730 RepID=UPI00165E9A2C|nr:MULTISPECIES: CCA tRNA nucleotidyltransferase [unclassified Leucobacter]MBC9926995.1 CCA tRNA nucleotidyltransferase [Leucobacter sp. cx-169]MBC9936274.1 CCA tRNA nucleotidyltransferase [Leucobacter sp. cx-87]
MHSLAESLDALREIAESRPVKALAEAFAAAGHEFALVGGPVRDALLGRRVSDLDFTTSARPDETRAILETVAAKTWDVGRAFGTIAARVHGETVEVTTYRAELYRDDSRKPEVTFGDTIEGDLVRRDFTINALALMLPSLKLVDVSGGVDDLLAGRIKTPGSAESSFTDDPLRMLRAARFSAQLGFVVEDDVRDAMVEFAPRLEIVSAERIRDELLKLLATDRPAAGIRLLVDTGLADRFLPELSELRATQDDHGRHKDVYEHSLTVLEQAIGLEIARRTDPDAGPDLVLRLAALLHDIGKPSTRKFERGGVTFHHHDLVGAKLARKRLRALRLDNETIASVARLIELHLRFFGYSDQQWTDSAVRRYVRDAGAELDRLHIITRADVTTRNRRKAERLEFAYDDIEARIVTLAEEEELAAVRPELDGEQIMALLGIGPGRDVGEAYRYLLEVRLDEGPIGEEAAADRLRDWWNARRAEQG